MQRYYRTAMDVSLLNEMLLQLFREAILFDSSSEPAAYEAVAVLDGITQIIYHLAICTAAVNSF